MAQVILAKINIFLRIHFFQKIVTEGMLEKITVLSFKAGSPSFMSIILFLSKKRKKLKFSRSP